MKAKGANRNEKQNLIDYEIITHCIQKELIFESLPYHNAVFVGKDEKGTPRYAAYRATNKSRLMGDASGSDKHYSFRLKGSNNSEVHLFECAIDALSYAPIESENFQSLPKNLAEKYKGKFKYPERITKVNGEIVAVPFKPKTKEAER